MQRVLTPSMRLTMKWCASLAVSLTNNYNFSQCMTNVGKALTWVCVIDGRLYTINLLSRQARSPTISPGRFASDLSSSRLTPIQVFLELTAAALDPVTTTLADLQTHLGTLIKPSMILLGYSLESDLYALQLAHPRCIDIALLFHHPRGRPLKPGLAWLTRKWLGRIIQDRGPGGHNPEEDARACIDLLKAKIKNGAPHLTCSSRCDKVDDSVG